MSKQRDIEEMPHREKVNPLWSAKKGAHPTWVDAEECRANWTKPKHKRAKRQDQRNHGNDNKRQFA